MAAEASATLKTALAATAVAALGPVLGQYALILVGAFGGALLALQRRDTLQLWWEPPVHILQGVLAALIFTGLLAHVASAVFPQSWGLSEDALQIPLAAVTAAGWRDVATLSVNWARAWARRKTDNAGGE